MVSCSVTGCKNRSSAAYPQVSSHGVSYHAFPFERPAILAQWLSFTRKPYDWYPTRYSRICSTHFPRHCYYTTAGEQPNGVRKNPRFLKPMAVPSEPAPRPEEILGRTYTSKEEREMEVRQAPYHLAEYEVDDWTVNKSIEALTGEDPMMAVPNIKSKSTSRKLKSEGEVKREFVELGKNLKDSLCSGSEDKTDEGPYSDKYGGNQLHDGNNIDTGVKNSNHIALVETDHVTDVKAESTEDKKPVFRWKINNETNQVELCLKGSSDDDSSDDSNEDLKDDPSRPVDLNLLMFPCDECSQEFSKRSQLRKHRRCVHHPDYACTICHMKFNHKGNLNNHTMRMHTTERPHSCTYCGKGFTRKFELRDHVRKHTGERPFVCGDCNKSFALLHQLKRHSKLHTKLKLLYPCLHCNKIFCRAHRMIRHKRTFVKPKTYTCKECNDTFEKRYDLIEHQKLHEQPLRCAECKEYFPNMAKLNEHSQTHCWDKVIYLEPPRKQFTDDK